MTLILALFWIALVSAFAILGSWYAKRYGRPDALTALYVTLVLFANIAVSKTIVFDFGFTELFAPGFHGTPGQFERTADLTRIMFPYIFFMGTAALGMAALNAKKKFAVAAFAPGLFNVALIAGAFALRGPLEARGIDASMALAISVLLGGLLQPRPDCTRPRDALMRSDRVEHGIGRHVEAGAKNYRAFDWFAGSLVK